MEDLWTTFIDAMKTAAKTNPKMALYAVVAVLVYALVDRQLRPFQIYVPSETGSSPNEPDPGTPNAVARAILNDLWLTPWFPILFMDMVVMRVGQGAAEMGDWLKSNFGWVIGADTEETETTDPVSLIQTLLAARLKPHFVRREPVPGPDGEWTNTFSWKVPSTDRVLISISMATLPLAAVEGAEAMGALLSGIGEIVPG